jgi:quercetin dioxygenase-like cupin family protein
MAKEIQSNIFQVGQELLWEEASPGVKRKIYGYNDTVMMVVVKFEKGAIGKLHKHPHTQVSYVESGEFELSIGEEKKVLKTGDGFYVPPDTMHGSVCIEPGILIDIFSPHREDFLNSNS